MMNLFRKKQASVEPVIPVDKSNAVPGFTKAIKVFGKAQEKMEPDFSIFFNKTMLEDLYDKFVNSEVAKIFTKVKGIIDSPGCLHEKCEYYIKDFGYDAEEASTVIAMLLQDVFCIKPEDVTLHIQLFGWDGQDSTVDFDYKGNVVAKSGFKHDLF